MAAKNNSPDAYPKNVWDKLCDFLDWSHIAAFNEAATQSPDAAALVLVQHVRELESLSRTLPSTSPLRQSSRNCFEFTKRYFVRFGDTGQSPHAWNGLNDPDPAVVERRILRRAYALQAVELAEKTLFPPQPT